MEGRGRGREGGGGRGVECQGCGVWGPAGRKARINSMRIHSMIQKQMHAATKTWFCNAPPTHTCLIHTHATSPQQLSAPPPPTPPPPPPPNPPKHTWWKAAGVSASVKSVGSKVSPVSRAYSSSPSVVAAAHESPAGLRVRVRVSAEGRLRVAVPGTSAAAAGSPPGGSSSSSESVGYFEGRGEAKKGGRRDTFGLQT